MQAPAALESLRDNPLYISAKIRAWTLQGEMRRRQVVYDRDPLEGDRLSWQLQRFNELWPEIKTHVPFYRDLSDRLSLPSRFSSWQEIAAAFPVVDKPLLRQKTAQLCSTAHRPDFWRVTGGSTAIPVQVPAWREEWDYTGPDRWLTRAWYGIRVEDRQFAIWGHSHALGAGARGFVNRRWREIKDHLLGYYRLSAYDMSERALRNGASAMLKFRPAYVYGYSVALARFALANQHLRDRLRALGLHAIIGAAEGFPSPHSSILVRETFDAPVAMEYGSVEADLVAHTTPQGAYRVLFLTYFAEAVPTGEETEEGRVCRIFITSLYPRCFPMIRYDLGDEIVVCRDSPLFGLTSFQRVHGRCNDYLLLSDETRIHSELISHCVRSFPEIAGYQAVQDYSGIRIEVLTSGPLSSQTIASIQYKLGRVNARLGETQVVRVQELQRTPAGKTPMVRRTVCERTQE